MQLGYVELLRIFSGGHQRRHNNAFVAQIVENPRGRENQIAQPGSDYVRGIVLLNG